MSINYYAFGSFPGGEADGGGLHIGQSATGWRFLFRAHPEQSVTTLLDWRHLLLTQATRIVNEYGRELTPDEMIETATARLDAQGMSLRLRARRGYEPHGYTVDDDGNAFCANEFC